MYYSYIGIGKVRLNEIEKQLNDEFKLEIREHGDIEMAYGRLVNKHSYRVLDGRTYDKDMKLLRNIPRWSGEIPEETDEVSLFLN